MYGAVRHPALPLYDAHSDINLPTYSDVMCVLYLAAGTGSVHVLCNST